MFEIVKTNSFKRDIEYYEHNTKVLDRLKEVVSYLAENRPLPKIYKDHKLKGELASHRECYILPDLLLVYEADIRDKIITLSYVGSHSGLFN